MPDRAAPIRPRVMEYDIINPGGNDSRLRMSSYGKNVLSSREQARMSMDVHGSPIAGKKFVARQGEASMDQIWPSDRLRPGFTKENRTLETSDINHNTQNQRMMRLKQQDSERIRAFMENKQRESSHGAARPYKNASNVFSHLADDPATR